MTKHNTLLLVSLCSTQSIILALSSGRLLIQRQCHLHEPMFVQHVGNKRAMISLYNKLNMQIASIAGLVYLLLCWHELDTVLCELADVF